jgi:hypothetical protein
MNLLATAADTVRPGVRGLFVLAGLFATWFVIDHFFSRIIGGNRAKDGGPGGSEKNIVGVIAFLATIFVGIMLGTRD